MAHHTALLWASHLKEQGDWRFNGWDRSVFTQKTCSLLEYKRWKWDTLGTILTPSHFLFLDCLYDWPTTPLPCYCFALYVMMTQSQTLILYLIKKNNNTLFTLWCVLLRPSISFPTLFGHVILIFSFIWPSVTLTFRNVPSVRPHSLMWPQCQTATKVIIIEPPVANFTFHRFQLSPNRWSY